MDFVEVGDFGCVLVNVSCEFEFGGDLVVEFGDDFVLILIVNVVV